MRAAMHMMIAMAMTGCGSSNDRHSQGIDGFRDTTIITEDWHNGLLVHHLVKYDSNSRVVLQTEHVSDFDTIHPQLLCVDRLVGRALAFGGYRVYTRSSSPDTLQVMDSVRMGRFLCLRDTTVIPDAHVIERRSVGYGTYQNIGLLIVPDRHDTIPLWSFMDPRMSRPIVWNWEEQTPPSWSEYQDEMHAMDRLSSPLVVPRSAPDTVNKE